MASLLGGVLNPSDLTSQVRNMAKIQIWKSLLQPLGANPTSVTITGQRGGPAQYPVQTLVTTTSIPLLSRG